MMRPRDDIKPESYIRWLDKAKRNYSTAKLNDLHGGYKDTTCYFCHQTVELALKAFLVAKQISFPRVHVLPQLLTLCAKKEAEFSDFSEDTIFLNRFYIEEKYPLDITVEHTSEDVENALNKAGNVLDFVVLALKT